MEKVSLSFFILVITIHAQLYAGCASISDDHPEPSRRQSFLMASKDIARCAGLSGLLNIAERSFGSLSKTYKYNNILANISFNACVIIPQVRQNIKTAASNLSSEELKILHSNLYHIRENTIHIARHQDLDLITPLLLESAHYDDGAMLIAETAVESLGDMATDLLHKVKFFKTAKTIADVIGADEYAKRIAKEERLLQMLKNFEIVGSFPSYFSVGKFDEEDKIRIKEIGGYLDEIKPILKKAAL